MPQKSIPICDEYYEVYEELSKKYNRLALLMQVGDFFEIYSPLDYSRTNLMELKNLLNFRDGIKNGYRMIGVPIDSFYKHLTRLVEHDFTVFTMVQSDDPDDELENITKNPQGKSNRKTRVLDKIYSPGTMLDSTRARNNALSLYIKQYLKGCFVIGIAVMDNTVSPEITVHQVTSTPSDKGLAIDKALQFVSQYEPVECIIVTEHGENVQHIVKQLGIKCGGNIHDRDVQTITEAVHGYSDPINYAAGALKTWVKDHNFPTADLKITPYHPETIMELSSTAIKQLDIPLFLSKKEINFTTTPMGNRLLFHRMCNPTSKVDVLEKRYSAIEEMINLEKNGSLSYENLEKILKECPDVDRLHRKISLGSLSWDQCQVLCQFYEKFFNLLDDAPIYSQIGELEDDDLKDFSTLETQFRETLFLGSETGIKFIEGIYPEIDNLELERKSAQNVVDEHLKKAQKAFPKGTFHIVNFKGIQTTSPRAKELCKQYKGWKTLENNKSSVLVYSDELRNALEILEQNKGEFEKLSQTLFTRFQQEVYGKMKNVLEKVSHTVALLDLLQASCNMAKTHKLVRPQLTNEKVLELEDVRHILIQNINQNVQYVPNDCFLSIDQIIGYLLYGVNACGKTSYLKAVGLAVVMAQAGLFVPVTKMRFKPFRRMMTRIAGGDNLERSQSSFIVEAEEIQSIINRANEHTLVLGDEMCRGTEVDSATAIVHTLVKWLENKGAFFLAATHLHDLADTLKDDKLVKIYHMKVDFDKDGDAIYNRKLIEGSGMRLYGLEIAKSLKFPEEFIQSAFNYRNNGEMKQVKMKKSRYNSKKITVCCEVCQYIPKDENSLPLDTHHYKFQCNADEDGYHGTEHKHALHNLIALCKQCHIKVHSKELLLELLDAGGKRKLLVKKAEPLQTMSASI
jgi:DNA mismatch repair protein MutS